MERIGSRFNLVMEYDKKLIYNKRITAIFTGNDWQSILRNMLFVHGLEFKIKEGKVMITT
ncbi:hypothetical protein [Paraflavitalea speifideaquila]|uniref:hypothetical protein n=1 Tax=Paraflavitalea speifideaquila TaxID=3076558 RepID=UPI0028EF0BB1|nr:hypothetical protein [Paraflavitalea speifideiaquila]